MILKEVKEKLKNAVRYFYDLQRLRMQSSARAEEKAKAAQAHLDEEDKAFLKRTGARLKELEKEALKEVERLLEGISIWETFLKPTRGIGPTLGGVLVAEVNIENCNTASQLWAWCGMATERFCKDCNEHIIEKPHKENRCPNCGSRNYYHKATKPRKGEKLKYAPWLKAKLIKVMGDCLLKAASLDELGYHYKVPAIGPDGKTLKYDELDDEGNKVLDENGKVKRKKVMKRVAWPEDTVCYREFYDVRKAKQENNIQKVCFGCKGTGKVVRIEKDKVVDIGTKKPRKMAKCSNCKGTGGPAPWGAGKAHRHADANRIMVKAFMLDLWKVWRKMEGLEVRPPYAEEYLRRAQG